MILEENIFLILMKTMPMKQSLIREIKYLKTNLLYLHSELQALIKVL